MVLLQALALIERVMMVVVAWPVNVFLSESCTVMVVVPANPHTLQVRVFAASSDCTTSFRGCAFLISTILPPISCILEGSMRRNVASCSDSIKSCNCSPSNKKNILCCLFPLKRNKSKAPAFGLVLRVSKYLNLRYLPVLSISNACGGNFKRERNVLPCRTLQNTGRIHCQIMLEISHQQKACGF
eukprot:TRINITY_DN27758_c0_g2_i1.p1 TRINITY_DN27758_c0_g2~~TRINITY_DN27758_c0_g2_i1.p1  ORF type:complete len:185 (-),score=8.76 TRINITY_DN27758_c0_g2_i1:483-1037(-)